MSDIPDEAVASALLTAREFCQHWSEGQVRDVLETALPHLTGWSDDDVIHDPRCRCLEPIAQARIRELEDAIRAAVDAIETGPLREKALTDPGLDMLRRRLREHLSGR